jgi:hypothetical protein
MNAALGTRAVLAEQWKLEESRARARARARADTMEQRRQTDVIHLLVLGGGFLGM